MPELNGPKQPARISKMSTRVYVEHNRSPLSTITLSLAMVLIANKR